jgi:penicillin-binding protein-related factor A (putative recombinase)
MEVEAKTSFKVLRTHQIRLLNKGKAGDILFFFLLFIAQLDQVVTLQDPYGF